MLLQNTILQQPSTPIQSCFKCQKPKRNSISCGCHRLGTNENSKESQNAQIPYLHEYLYEEN